MNTRLQAVAKCPLSIGILFYMKSPDYRTSIGGASVVHFCRQRQIPPHPVTSANSSGTFVQFPSQLRGVTMRGVSRIIISAMAGLLVVLIGNQAWSQTG